jgi:hypothetical protein
MQVKEMYESFVVSYEQALGVIRPDNGSGSRAKR